MGQIWRFGGLLASLSACFKAAFLISGSAALLSVAAAADESKVASLGSTAPKRLVANGLNVGFADYPPDQYKAANDQVIGWAIELLNEVGVVLKVPVRYTQIASFQSLLPGVDAGRYDLALGGFSITEERKKRFDFVSYFNSGNSIVIRAGRPEVKPDGMCGHKAAIALGSFFGTIVESFSKKCQEAGKPPIELLTFPSQEAVLIALDSGRADFTIGSLSASMYLSKETKGRYVLSGAPLFRTTAGLAFRKGDDEVRDAVHAALNTLVANGAYMRILAKWGIEAGAVGAAAVNP